ncbi:MAG: hypothetical protein K2O82_06790, partial [Alistipes sp.]|nr:hypothetical protein [Alistipes sp.]
MQACTPTAPPSGRIRALSYVDVQNLFLNCSGVHLDLHAVALLVAQQRLGDGRADRQLALAQ